MEKDNEKPDLKKENEKDEPTPGKSEDVSDATSDTSLTSLTAKVKKFDVKKFVDCPMPEKISKPKKKKEGQEETPLDYFTNVPKSALNVNQSTTEIVKKLVKSKAKGEFGKRKRVSSQIRLQVTKFPAVEESGQSDEDNESDSEEYSDSESLSSIASMSTKSEKAENEKNEEKEEKKSN